MINTWHIAQWHWFNKNSAKMQKECVEKLSVSHDPLSSRTIFSSSDLKWSFSVSFSLWKNFSPYLFTTLFHFMLALPKQSKLAPVSSVWCCGEFADIHSWEDQQLSWMFKTANCQNFIFYRAASHLLMISRVYLIISTWLLPNLLIPVESASS